MATITETATKHGYIELTKTEARQSKATHQHKSMHEMNERYALTLDIDADEWTHNDHRGDEYREGIGAMALDEHLTQFHEDDE